MAAAAQQVPSFPGRVQKVGGTGLGHVTVRIEGAGSTSTSDSGEFTFPFSGSLKIGYPAIFHVTNWVIVKPCELKNGRTYLHDPVAEPIEILVLPPHDPRLLSAAASGSLIDCIIEEEVSQIAPKSPAQTGPGGSSRNDEHRPSREPAHPLESQPGMEANSDISRLHLMKAAYRSAPGRDSQAPASPNSTHPEVPDREGFLAAKAGELGVSTAELKSAMKIWKSSVESLYEKGLAALDDLRYEEAIRYISESLSSPDADVLRNVPLAYAEYQQGLYPAAESALRKVMAVHPGDPIVLNNLGAVLLAEARYSEAELEAGRTLAIDEKALGPNSPRVATDLNNLASIYSDEGRNREAEQLLKRALDIDKKAVGSNSPQVAIRLNNLANLYIDEGKYSEAERLLKQTLAIDKITPGPGERAIASDFNNLAALYTHQKKYSEAEPWSQRALEIDERELGLNHPFVAMDLNNLAVIYREQGKYDQAEPMFNRALAIDEKALGPDHPDLATDIKNLGILYRKTGNYSEAERLLERALTIDEKALGSDHPSVALVLNNLGLLYYDQHRYGEAEPLYMRALTIDEKSLGREHPDLVEVEENLARTLHSLGNDAKAKVYEEQAAKIRKIRESREENPQ
jgi:tetratricopeptide (TPR) repeat protein